MGAKQLAPPAVAIVVTLRNAGAAVDHLLASLDRLTWPDLEFSLTDAFSTDGTWERLQAWAGSRGSAGRVHLAQVAGGIGAGRNAAIRATRAPFVAVTDADMQVPPDWIERLMEGMGQGRGVVGGPNEGGDATYLERCTNVLPVHGPSRMEVPVFGRSRFRHGFTTREDVFAAVTRNCLYRREAIEAVGGFDESLITTEDGELHRRILDAGYTIRYEPEAVVLHRHRTSLRAFWRQMRNYARGQAQANRKHPSMHRLRHNIPLLGIMAFLASLALGISVPGAWMVPAVLGTAAVALAIAYGVKAAALRREPSLWLGTAVLFALWQTAWAVGYLEGAVGLARRASHAD